MAHVQYPSAGLPPCERVASGHDDDGGDQGLKKRTDWQETGSSGPLGSSICQYLQLHDMTGTPTYQVLLV